MARWRSDGDGSRYVGVTCVERLEHGVAAVGGKIYAVGGVGHNFVTLSSMERFDPATSMWETLPPMSGPHFLDGTVAI